MSDPKLPIHNKIILATCVWVLIAFFMLASSFRLQLLDGQKFLKQASAINRAVDRISASRGLIYDVNGVRLVNNDPQFNLYVLPAELNTKDLEKLWQELSDKFGSDAQSLASNYQKRAFTNDGKLVGERVTLINDVAYDKFLAHIGDLDKFPGVYISSEPKRTYSSSKTFAHVLGYLGDVNLQEKTEFALDSRARIGKEGVEKTFDQALRGQDGKSIRETSVGEQATRSWVVTDSRAGDNIYLTIDKDWQDNLYRYLEKYTEAQDYALGGAAVIMEADSGKLKALVNYPTFDVNAFSQGISVNDFNNLLNDERYPLLNRAIAMQIPAGSIFKIFMAAPLLEEGVIGKSSVFKSGCFELPGGYKICEADKRDYGNLNLTQAIARSSNPYFCQASVAMAGKLGDDDAAIRKLDEYFAQLGIGKQTKLQLPGEQKGTVPSPELKLKLQNEPWYLADLCNTAIGQGLVTATPVQMAVATAAIINGGNVLKPQILAKTEDENLNVRIPEFPEIVSKLAVSPQNLNIIKEGMLGAVEYGSAAGLKDSPGNPRAKTGSSEAGKQKVKGQSQAIELAHSWVVGSFSYNNKDYVFVVAIQFGGRGFRSVPVVVDFIDCVYKKFQDCK